MISSWQKAPPRLIFDTSAVNALARDADCEAILAGLGVAFRVGITETVIGEVAAHPDESGRRVILNVLKRLLAYGKCVMPFHWIIAEQAKAYASNPTSYDWRRLDVRFREAEVEIARQDFVHSLSEETRAEQRELATQYEQVFSMARPVFQELFVGRDGERPTLEIVVEVLLGEGGAHLELGADLVERATGKRPTSESVKNLLNRCPPLRALLTALCVSQYDRCIRADRTPTFGKAGRLDSLSATYLPYCEFFITNDNGQLTTLTTVNGLIAGKTIVERYSDFTRRFLTPPLTPL